MKEKVRSMRPSGQKRYIMGRSFAFRFIGTDSTAGYIPGENIIGTLSLIQLDLLDIVES